MRVLFIIDSFGLGGTERSLAELLPSLDSSGVEVAAVQLQDRGQLAVRLRRTGIDVRTTEGAGRAGTTWQLRQLIRSLGPDVVHTQLFEADVLGRFAAFSARVPVVSSIVSTPYGRERTSVPGLSRSKLRAAQSLDALTARAADRFHAVSRSAATAAVRRLRIDPRRIEVIPRGRDGVALGRRSESRRRSIRSALGIVDSRPVILAAGRQTWAKGFDVLLGALPTVLADHPDALLVVAGSPGDQTHALRAQSDATGSGGHAVRWLGQRDDVADLMVAADVLAFPSRWEGMPGTLVEALALELPIVASSIDSVVEVVGGLRGAVLTPPEEQPALATAISRALHARMDTSGHRQRFEERYELRTVTQQMVGFYESVLLRAG